MAGAALVIGLILRGWYFHQWGLDPHRADMIPLVQAALDRLRHGDSPYGWYVIASKVPLTYLPLGWLAYWPAWRVGLDLRAVNVLAELALWPLLGPIAGAIWFLLPTTIAADALTVAPVQWVALLGVLLAVRHRWGGIVLGLALSTSVLTLPVVPFLALRWLKAEGWSSAVSRLAQAGLVSALIVGPWLLTNPTGFLDGVVRWFNDLDQFPRMTWQQTRAWADQPSLARWFWLAGKETWLKPLQALSVLICLGWAGLVEDDRSWTRVVGLALLLFVALNPVVWIYLYGPGVLIGLVSRRRSESTAETRDPSLRIRADSHPLPDRSLHPAS